MVKESGVGWVGSDVSSFERVGLVVVEFAIEDDVLAVDPFDVAVTRSAVGVAVLTLSGVDTDGAGVDGGGGIIEDGDKAAAFDGASVGDGGVDGLAGDGKAGEFAEGGVEVDGVNGGGGFGSGAGVSGIVDDEGADGGFF